MSSTNRNIPQQSKPCTSNEAYVNMITSMVNFTTAANDFMQSSNVEAQRPDCHRQLESILTNLNTQLTDLCGCAKELSKPVQQPPPPKGRLIVRPRSPSSKEKDKYICPSGPTCDSKDCRRCREAKKSKLPVSVGKSSSAIEEFDKPICVCMSGRFDDSDETGKLVRGKSRSGSETGKPTKEKSGSVSISSAEADKPAKGKSRSVSMSSAEADKSTKGKSGSVSVGSAEADKPVRAKSGSGPLNSTEVDEPEREKSGSDPLETAEADQVAEKSATEEENPVEEDSGFVEGNTTVIENGEGEKENEGGEPEGTGGETEEKGEEPEDEGEKPEEEGVKPEEEGVKPGEDSEEPGEESAEPGETGDEEIGKGEGAEETESTKGVKEVEDVDLDELFAETESTASKDDNESCGCSKMGDQCLCDEQDLCKCDRSVECEIPDSAIKKLYLLRELRKKLMEAEKNLLDLQKEITCLGRAMANQAEVCKQPTYTAAIYKQIMKTTTSIDEISSATNTQPYVKRIVTTEEYRRIPSKVPTRVLNTATGVPATPPRICPQDPRTCPGLAILGQQQYRERPPPTMYTGMGMPQMQRGYAQCQPCIRFGSHSPNAIMPITSTPVRQPQTLYTEEKVEIEEIEPYHRQSRSRTSSSGSYCDKKHCRRKEA